MTDDAINSNSDLSFETNDIVFWDQVFRDIFRLAEIMKKMKAEEDIPKVDASNNPSPEDYLPIS